MGTISFSSKYATGFRDIASYRENFGALIPYNLIEKQTWHDTAQNIYSRNKMLLEPDVVFLLVLHICV